jgi:hypothetical protein
MSIAKNGKSTYKKADLFVERLWRRVW